MSQNFGLQIWNEEKIEILNVQDRITRTLGVFNTGRTNGSITNTDLLLGTPFYAISASYNNMAGQTVIYFPSFTVSGSTISWSFSGGSSSGSFATRVDCTIVYGVF